jgi:predicted RecB family nuclease
VTGPRRVISGTMIRHFLICECKAGFEVHGDLRFRDPVPAFTRMLWQARVGHEGRFLSGFGFNTIDMRVLSRPDREQGTLSAIDAEAPIILGSVIPHDDLIGMRDLLRSTPKRYLALNVKSGGAVEGSRGNYKKDHLVQVAHYAYTLRAAGLGRSDIAGIVARTGLDTYYAPSLPLGRERVSGTNIHMQLLDRVRRVRVDRNATRGAISAFCSMCEWKTFCRNELTATDDLTSISGLGPAVGEPIEQTAQTIAALAELDAKTSPAVPSASAARLRRFVERARVLADQEAGPTVREPLRIATPRHAIDFEVEPHPLRGLVYPHWCWHGIAGEGRFVHFFAETAEEVRQRKASAEAIEHFRQYRDAHRFHSANERTAYRGLQQRHPDVCGAAKIDRIFAAERCTDVYAIISKQTDWPLSSYGIKCIARSCGFEWEDFDPGGVNGIEWYDRYGETGDTELRDRNVAYNRDDVVASQVVRNALTELETNGTIATFRRPAK